LQEVFWAKAEVVGVKIREVIGEWPPRKWAPDDASNVRLASDPGELRLLWFSVPDQDGWFRLTATDSRGASWSAYCRTPAQNVWHPLEQALGKSLKEPLELVGDVDLDYVARPHQK
jgi:hypothetical protein